MSQTHPASAPTATRQSSGSRSRKTSTSIDEPEFVLKHRIVGAAFLLFFGALVLPWVLGAPHQGSDASEGSNTVDVPSAASIAEQTPLDELAAAIEAESSSVEERVYISKITPLDATPEPQTAAAESKASSAQESVKTDQQNEAVEQATAAVIKTNSTSSNNSASGGTDAKATPVQAPESKARDTSVAETKPQETIVKPAKKPDVTKAIEVGWVVQVGVFTDKKGANRVVADLRDKGFSPSTTIVDTNRGKATGTRIWLGPYAQRVEAAKAKTTLTEKTGEAGFIRAYP